MPNLVEISPVVLDKKIFLISSIYFRYFIIISPWKRVGPFIWTNLNHQRLLCAKFGWFWKKNFLNFVNVFLLFRFYLPLEKGMALHLFKLESTSSKNAVYQVFWISSMYFRYFVIISPWKSVGHFIWTNLNPLHPKIALCQVWLKLTHWFWRRFFNIVNVFFAISLLSPCGKRQSPSFEQTWIPLTTE